jgi:hypothetical protein
MEMKFKPQILEQDFQMDRFDTALGQKDYKQFQLLLLGMPVGKQIRKFPFLCLGNLLLRPQLLL